MTKIEWLRNPITGKQGYTINPVKGLCPVACPYCYARRIYKRFKWDKAIRLKPEVMSGSVLSKIPNGSRIFVGSTMELFGEWIAPEWSRYIFGMISLFPKLTFVFLTKRPENLHKWSPFPENCYIGCSADTLSQFASACDYFPAVKAKVKFISFEPLLESMLKGLELPFQKMGINWVILGQQKPISPKTQPKLEWIKEIVDAANKAGIAIFLKDNLLELVNYESKETDFAFNKDGFYRQEFPEVPHV